MFGKKMGNIFLTFGKEFVHVGSPELIDSFDFVVELVVEVISLSFVSLFHFVELLAFEFLFAMFPFDTAPLSIDVLTFLLVFDHFFVEDSEVLVEAEHSAGSHELAHLGEDIM